MDDDDIPMPTQKQWEAFNERQRLRAALPPRIPARQFDQRPVRLREGEPSPMRFFAKAPGRGDAPQRPVERQRDDDRDRDF